VKLIVGLGNPGLEYCRTRHNAGWMVLERVAQIYGISVGEARFDGVLGARGDIWLFKPLTYMNDSGAAVKAALAGAGAELTDWLVLVDDLNLPLGSLRVRSAGSSGGHRGLDSIVRALESEQFARLRIGIGPCPPGVSKRDFVLSEFAEEEMPLLADLMERSAQAVECWIEDGIEVAMNAFNRTSGPER